MFSGAEGREASRALARYSGLGCGLAAGIAFFSGLGWLLDRALGTEPYLLAACCLGGSAVALYKLVRDVSRMGQEADNEDGPKT